jgi:hypothetical protein
MKQYEAVILALEKLGGQATLASLYREALKIKGSEWKTKTPFASIRRIVQVHPEIFRVRPGLWALRSYQNRLNLTEYDTKRQLSAEEIEQNHAFFQGMLLSIGNMRKFNTYLPNQDKNKLFINRPLRELRSLKEIPGYSYENIVKRSSSIDVIWFNTRLMPHSIFEIEHSTDFQNSLIKFLDLQDFNTRMVIVADAVRKAEFDKKIEYYAFAALKNRVDFLRYDRLVEQYENEIKKSGYDFIL